MRIDVNEIGRIAILAGKAIMKVYDDPESQSVFSSKEDNSPLTIADKKSHEIIAGGLYAVTPQLPVLSEEGKSIAYEERIKWEHYWCVDPLDGTKEFLKRNGEFTVNIALIEKDTPVLGVIYVPVSGDLYIGDKEGSFKVGVDGARTKLSASTEKSGWTAIGSRSHSSPDETTFLSKYPVTNIISAGSSLKFCLVAEGKAQIYYRHAPTMEWDTAAGHAIAVGSGAVVILADGNDLLYNKPNLKNESFVCRVKI